MEPGEAGRSAANRALLGSEAPGVAPVETDEHPMAAKQCVEDLGPDQMPEIPCVIEDRGFPRVHGKVERALILVIGELEGCATHVQAGIVGGLYIGVPQCDGEGSARHKEVVVRKSGVVDDASSAPGADASRVRRPAAGQQGEATERDHDP